MFVNIEVYNNCCNDELRDTKIVMNYRIGIVICYFGNLPQLFDLWRMSCNNNKEIDFILFTDQNVEDLNDNIKIINCSLLYVKQLAETKLGLTEISLNTSYKLCDYKAMYGVIFEDYLKEYDFWGICDMDMIFGNIMTFLSDDILDKYDKVYQLGHLTLYRNSEEVNNRFKLEGYCDWRYVVNTQQHCRLCERGMMQKYRLANIPVYESRDYADISKIHKRFQLSHWLVPKKQKDKYKHQLFYYENGHIYRSIYISGKIETQEFNYIHLQKRKMEVESGINNFFYISDNKIFSKQPGEPSISEILLLNPYRGRLFELFECIKYEVKTKNLLKRYISRINIKRKKI